MRIGFFGSKREHFYTLKMRLGTMARKIAVVGDWGMKKKRELSTTTLYWDKF
jgi:hypothetical protein